MEGKDYLLQLSTERPERPVIRIDDQEFELSVPDDFELEEFLQLSQAGQEASALMSGSERLTKEKVKHLTGLLNDVVKSAVRDLPDEVFAKLRTVQKFSIVNVFSSAVTEKMGGSAPQKTQEEEKPGLNSSLDSQGSTEELQTTG